MRDKSGFSGPQELYEPTQRRPDTLFENLEITRKMMELFFTQDFRSIHTSKATHHGGRGGTRRKPGSF